MRLAAVRAHHLAMGYPDPFDLMRRAYKAVEGIKRRQGTKERRRGITPDMLKWLVRKLSPWKYADDAVLWAATNIGFF